MGFLDNTSVIVDAILTKHGRKKLADGHDLGIKHFALADDGVDYTLYNVNHISGSNYYGADITGMPLTEAVPDDVIAMRYKLVTRARNTVFNPYIIVQGAEVGNKLTIEKQGKNYAKQLNIVTRNHGDEQYFVTILDATRVNVHGGGAGTPVGGAANSFVHQASIKDPRVFKCGPDGLSFTGKPTSVQIVTQGIIEGATSGAVQSFQIVTEPNILNDTKTQVNAGTRA